MCEGLTADQVDQALISLKQKEIDEQIRSDKVLEGILKDIGNSLERIADAKDVEVGFIEQEKEMLKWDNEKKQWVKAKPVENAELGETRSAVESAVSKVDLDGLADLVDLIAKDNTELVAIAKHAEQMNMSLRQVMAQLSDMNIRLVKFAEITQVIAEEKRDRPTEPDEAEVTAEAEQETEQGLLHCSDAGHGNKLALCGCMGTPSQPVAARMNEPVTLNPDDVKCPDCLAIIASWTKS